MDFNIDERADYHNIYALRDKHGKLYLDVLELHTIELKKNPNKEKPCPLNEWHSLFNAKTEEDRLKNQRFFNRQICADAQIRRLW